MILFDNIEVQKAKELEIKKLQNQRQIYSELQPKQLLIELFTKPKQTEIFNLKKRKNLEIEFRNAKGWYCAVDYAYLNKKTNNVVIVWHFKNKPEEQHKVSLDRFIEIYRNKEFFNIAPRPFYEHYFMTAEKKLKEIDEKLKELNN